MPSFVAHTPETAPEDSRPHLRRAQEQFGFVPDALARMAESPTVTEAFHRLLEIFNASSLSPLEREVIAMTLARQNGCGVCRALHSALLARMRTDAALVEALRQGGPLPEPRLEALAAFAREASRGPVGGEAWAALLAAGYSPRQGLDALVGVAAYSLSTVTNHLTGARVDPPFEKFL